MPKRRKYNASAKKNASHAKPNNVAAAVQAYPMECTCCAAAFPESMTVVRDVHDVSQSGVHDSLQNLQDTRRATEFPDMNSFLAYFADSDSAPEHSRFHDAQPLFIFLSDRPAFRPVEDRWADDSAGHCVLEERTIWSNVQAYPMECICCAAAFPESMTVVRDVYDVSQSGVHDSLQNLQGGLSVHLDLNKEQAWQGSSGNLRCLSGAT
ncbi:hypothetical protein M513_11908 [Trichuris suis]|uniref:Uncharacterized protein n=1 Tax=Trichuris suis TaxID=68888 RepID=A0A085LQF5_9BILA|nr:hypothetical protein M513_11908 [Trichuris suis]